METSVPEAGLRVDCVGMPGTTIVKKKKVSALVHLLYKDTVFLYKDTVYYIKIQCLHITSQWACQQDVENGPSGSLFSPRTKS